MPDTTRDTAAAMLRALRAAEASSRTLAEGLADALEELLERDCVNYYDLETIIDHLRNSTHASST